MSDIEHQLLITLVHGTWPRGLFPPYVRFRQWLRKLTRLRKPWEPPPFWFEQGSHFLTRLSAEFHDVPHKITTLSWSGANSIGVRNKAAHDLANYLAAEHAQHPRATQLIIAHSHGGNVALRALHLQKRDGVQASGAERAPPLVVTLATPFVEIHQADIGERTDQIRWAVVLAVGSILYFYLQVAEVLRPSSVGQLIVAVPSGFWGWYWVYRRAGARQKRVEALSNATRLGEVASSPPVLVIRAIDDEAALIMAVGAAVNYVMAKLLAYSFYILAFFSIIFIGPEIFLTRNHTLPIQSENYFQLSDWYRDASRACVSGVTIALLGLLSVARTVHGKGLAVSPMDCQINTQSTPDAVDLSKTATLVGPTVVQSLRHSIYDHEDCTRMISGWVRSRLVSFP